MQEEKFFSLETKELIATNICWNGPLPSSSANQDGRNIQTLFNMRRYGKIIENLLSQLQPNFRGFVLS